MTYESARAITDPFLAVLGASAATGGYCCGLRRTGRLFVAPGFGVSGGPDAALLADHDDRLCRLAADRLSFRKSTDSMPDVPRGGDKRGKKQHDEIVHRVLLARGDAKLAFMSESFLNYSPAT